MFSNGYIDQSVHHMYHISLKEDNMTRGHKTVLVKSYFRLDKRKFSFSQRTINDSKQLSHDCVNASSFNMFTNKIDNCLARAGYNLR